jgi:hypothetical protein
MNARSVATIRLVSGRHCSVNGIIRGAVSTDTTADGRELSVSQRIPKLACSIGDLQFAVEREKTVRISSACVLPSVGPGQGIFSVWRGHREDTVIRPECDGRGIEALLDLEE